MRLSIAILAAVVVLVGLVLWPRADLIVAGWFFRPDDGGFFLSNNSVFFLLNKVAYKGARLIGLALILLAIVSFVRKKPTLGLNTKACVFLFLGLVLGPGIIVNGVFKDHWGRARPAEVTEFGGAAHFSPALVPANQCDRNCSFVSGDGAFGFFLPALAYVVPLVRSRRVFWGGMALGATFSIARVMAGAHFLSDTLFAALFVQGVLLPLHRIMYGGGPTWHRWREWLFLEKAAKDQPLKGGVLGSP